MTELVIGMCWDGVFNLAVSTARELRQCGVAVDMALAGKVQKQFERLKRSGLKEIVMVRQDGSCRVWRLAGHGRSCEGSIDDVIAYFRWIADDSDAVPDPPEHMLAFDPSGEWFEFVAGLKVR